jgi:hypothetical protein
MLSTQWTVHLALSVVSDGGLQVSPVGGPTTSSFADPSDGVLASYTGYIRNFVETHVEERLGIMLGYLTDALADQHKLFLPASGTFLMRDAKFNHRSDLLITLAYNG